MGELPASAHRAGRQVAALWQKPTVMAAFVREQFVSDEKQLDALVTRMQEVFEQIDGHNNEIQRELRRPLDTDSGPLRRSIRSWRSIRRRM